MVEDRRIKREVIFPSYRLSSVFLPSLQKAFRETLINIKDIDIIAVSTGPGSFTGLRIGMSIGKSLSLSQHIPLIGIPTPYIIRENVPFPRYPLLILIGARKGEVYTFLYRKERENWEEIIREEITKIQDLKGRIRERKFIAVGEGALKYKEQIKENLGEKVEFLPFPQNIPRPSNLAFLAEKEKIDFEKGLSLSPIYIGLPRIGKGSE